MSEPSNPAPRGVEGVNSTVACCSIASSMVDVLVSFPTDTIGGRSFTASISSSASVLFTIVAANV